MNPWDKVYSQKQMAQYPDTELVRFVARNYYNVPKRQEIKFFDVGCGVGASAWYLAREGFSVACIDKSLVAVSRLKARLDADNLEATILCGDLAKMDFKSDYFDCIIDVNSLCYLDGKDIDGVMDKLYKVLKPGGKIFSMAPSSICAKPPFNHTIEGVNLDSRFLNLREVKRQFDGFSEVDINPYKYGSKSSRIYLWETQAVKK